MKIGVSNLQGNKKEYFGFIANEDNLYRILPPLHSLADEGRFSQYYALHSIWLRDPANPESKARPYHFQCIEKVNKESKMIQTHCPHCDVYRANLEKYDTAKKEGLDAEQLKAFHQNHVRPYQPQKKFYVNAVNQENKAGVLPLGIKQFFALQDRLVQTQAQFNMDATGVEGLFFNFRKVQKFKGDRDTVYHVEHAQESFMQDGQPMQRLKGHKLTPEFINYLATATKDLGSLFRTITVEEQNAILTASPENKKEVVEKIFAKGEPHVKSEITVGGTNATAVGNLSLDAAGASVNSPAATMAAPAPTLEPTLSVPAPTLEPVSAAPAPTLAPASSTEVSGLATSQPVSAAPAPAGSVSPVNTSNMNDEDFLNSFMGDTK